MARKPAAEPKDARSAVIAAAMALAAERDWAKVGMAEIAEKAGIDLAEMRRTFPAKPAIIAAFMRQIDDEVLAKAPRRAEGQSTRDALFDVIMARFDALQPHKPALNSIRAAMGLDPALVRATLASQAWMLHAAGAASDGPLGTVKVFGLAGLYAGVFDVWLRDEDPAMSRTMAALDSRLRRGERSMSTVEEAGAGLDRMCRSLCGLFKPPARRGGDKPADQGAAPAT
jgi:AcrR family transcriptional regulator